MLTERRIVLGITGGIAAYKAAELVSRLKKAGAQVRVVMTKNAQQFIAPLTLETLSGQQVYSDSFEKAWEIEHISLQKYADLMIVAPATANILGKYAHGIADDLLSTTLMAMSAPVLIAPAMNAQMFGSAANQANMALLAARGVHFVGPERGFLACGDEDIGRMSEPSAIVEAAIALLGTVRGPDLLGKRVLVTAGPTREMIDPVRFLSNRSTGRMGYAIAEAAKRRGADVMLLSGPVSIDAPHGVELVSVVSADELCEQMVAHAPKADIVIQAAAPADYKPKSVSLQKIKKGEGDMAIALERTPDIASTIAKGKRSGQIFVIFAAETHNLIESAREKRLRKGADLVVANDVTAQGAGFAGDTNIVTIIGERGEVSLPLMRKLDVADAILDRCLAL